jgi:hypothetical protein
MMKLGRPRINVRSGQLGTSMRKKLRKSMPYFFALLAGTLAGVCVAGFAFYAAAHP